MQAVKKGQRPDGHAGEGAEGGAGPWTARDQRSAQYRQQGVAAPEAARRDRWTLRAHLAEARARPRAM